jgi:hypothetical protein
MSTKKEESKPKKTERELEAISDKVKASKLKIQDIIIPLSVGLILVLLALFVFIPMVRSAMEFRSEYAEIKEREDQLKVLEDTLKKIDEETLQVDLSNAKEIIPRNLRVSTFVYYIDVLAAEKSLTSRSLSAADTQVTVRQAGQKREDGRTYLGVSSPLTYSGSLDDILSFLDTLYSASPYIISIHNVSLRGTEQDWRVTMSVRGYYVPESEFKVDIYAPFELYTKHESILEVFRQKREQLR